MRLENILALTGAKLLNRPSIHTIENITFEASEIKRGDLFFAKNREDISVALQNGAYAIVFEGSLSILDDEVAWLSVHSLDDALVKLLRFRLIEKKVIAFACETIILEIAERVLTEPPIFVLNSNLSLLCPILWNIPDSSTLLFSMDFLTQSLCTDVRPFVGDIAKKIIPIGETLFEVSFIFNEFYFERERISPLFLPFLEQLLQFYALHGIRFAFKKVLLPLHFEPVFVSKNRAIKEFGSTQTVVIFENDISLLAVEIAFLQSRARWSEQIVILPHTLQGLGYENCFFYTSESEILTILQTASFGYALVFGATKEILILQEQGMKQLSLEF